ncbi:MAG TPA: S-adenosylmethionine decarboxylase [Gammaproteobacteria bacterium]|jgi:S-adenosylmethionine/arginine decarboxylase-like enzyme|nr:S-adenosylmethionine decarboxylase [Gammaproteobacteria bacterium]
MSVREVCFAPEESWGLSCSVDVKNCNPVIIRSAELIRDYVVKLCELIEMKRFGECQVVHFGEDEKVAGYSMVQLIETSLISGHFANATNAAYIDIFSCKTYDPAVVAEFTKNYFKGDSVNVIATDRI